MNISNPTDIKSIIDKNKKNIAFVIGNGINRHFEQPIPQWKEMLLDLYKQLPSSCRKDEKDVLRENNNESEILKGISLTEFYDLLELRSTKRPNSLSRKDAKKSEKPKDRKRTLQSEIKCKLSEFKPVEPDKQKNLLCFIKNRNIPILTTNFDDLMGQSLELKKPRILKGHNKIKGFTDLYPWSSYYSGEELEHPNSGFAIWHINGMKYYQRSIKLGLSHYMKNVSRVDDLIKERIEKCDNAHRYNRTWLKIFFEKRLVIFGLGLEENEIFLRWLLLQKKRYRHILQNSDTDDRDPECGWYIATSSGMKESGKGKKLFLNAVGIEVHEVKDYDAIYKTPWS